MIGSLGPGQGSGSDQGSGSGRDSYSYIEYVAMSGGVIYT